MRAGLVAFALVTLAVAAILTGRADRPGDAALPSVVPPKLGSLAIRAGVAEDVPVDPEVAVDVVRSSVFLGEAPGPQPLVLPTLVSGPVARYPVMPSPTGQVVAPVVEDAPAWLVVWRGLRAEKLERFGDWPEGTLVDAVFVVDGQMGDCCWFTGFLAGDSRLG